MNDPKHSFHGHEPPDQSMDANGDHDRGGEETPATFSEQNEAATAPHGGPRKLMQGESARGRMDTRRISRRMGGVVDKRIDKKTNIASSYRKPTTRSSGSLQSLHAMSGAKGIDLLNADHFPDLVNVCHTKPRRHSDEKSSSTSGPMEDADAMVAGKVQARDGIRSEMNLQQTPTQVAGITEETRLKFRALQNSRYVVTENMVLESVVVNDAVTENMVLESGVHPTLTELLVGTKENSTRHKVGQVEGTVGDLGTTATTGLLNMLGLPNNITNPSQDREENELWTGKLNNKRDDLGMQSNQSTGPMQTGLSNQDYGATAMMGWNNQDMRGGNVNGGLGGITGPPNAGAATWENKRASFAQLMKHCNQDEDTKLEYTAPVITESGKTRIILSEETIIQGSKPYTKQLYGYFVGTSMDFRAVQSSIRRLSKPYDFESVAKNATGFYFFKFYSEEGMNAVIENGPWLIDNIPLILHRWEPGLNLSKIEPSKITIWACIHNLPLELWNGKGIGQLASGIGKPLLMDRMTRDRCIQRTGRMGYARVLVELDATLKIPSDVEVQYPPMHGRPGKITTLPVTYQWKPKQCTHCNVFGHSTGACMLNPDKIVILKRGDMEQDIRKRDEIGKGTIEEEAEFTVVKRKHRGNANDDQGESSNVIKDKDGQGSHGKGKMADMQQHQGAKMGGKHKQT